MTRTYSATRSLSIVAIGLAVLVLAALVWLGVVAPTDTHPLFYFGLIFLGGGAIGLLSSGVGVAAAGSRTPTTRALDLQFFQGIRRLVVAMWLCVIVFDALGVLVVLAVAGGRGSTPVGTGALTVAFAAAAVTVVCAGIASVVMRRLLPKR
ncbi:hypothetical protein LWP59_18395 [Amycolatopsis acidiphila]|uniref:Uncharacterized protein n=1 Tax=Amycolatopsis acidiphila TaxID=715473 RepID=A0A557ZTZ7_9PSEU|nr:hypothetical protein [Amycolatopsis acidiphila]TVT15489.1 hypothetical protein FNH06_36095 [Amycolatopsis acidiphila]UIJ63459.1 hypothetical protein LWP59_18395 [Amycolatopsis acidiphila]GHG99155.1 hypothetical protein GCM10017788_79620 [Amycolatopsis acidiphila]